MNILSLLKRFIPPYKWQVVANLFFNVLSTVLSLFSFATIIPVLQILFGLSEGTAAYMPLGAAATMSDTLDILKNNLYYFLQMQIGCGLGSMQLMRPLMKRLKQIESGNITKKRCRS